MKKLVCERDYSTNLIWWHNSRRKIQNIVQFLLKLNPCLVANSTENFTSPLFPSFERDIKPNFFKLLGINKKIWYCLNAKILPNINVSHYTGSIINKSAVMWRNFMFSHQHKYWLLQKEVQWWKPVKYGSWLLQYNEEICVSIIHQIILSFNLRNWGWRRL